MPGYNGYIYRNESISEENFKMVVTVFAVGQGSCNTIEIMDGDKLVYLACIDLGTSSGKDYINIYDEDYGPIAYLKGRMKKRVEDGGMEDTYYAYMDMFFLTHQDDDHHNMLPDLIKALDNEQQGPDKKTKYINEMYLGGFDYGLLISAALDSIGSIGRAVNKMYHISQDNSIRNAGNFVTKMQREEPDTIANGMVRVCLNWLLSCGCINNQFVRPGVFPKVTIRRRRSDNLARLAINFPSGKPRPTAETRNESSTLLHLSVTFPSRTGTDKTVSFIFPGDAQVTTFQALQNARVVPVTGMPLLFVMPHHGAYNTAITPKGSRRNGDEFTDLKRFVDILRGEDQQIQLALASAAVTRAAGSRYYCHPNKKVVEVFKDRCADVDILPDLDQCCIVSQCIEQGSASVETVVEDKFVCTTEFVMNQNGSDILRNLNSNACATQEEANEKKFKLCRRNFQIEIDAERNGLYTYAWGYENVMTPQVDPWINYIRQRRAKQSGG